MLNPCSHRRAPRPCHVAVALGLLLLAGCARHVPLTDSDRARLAKEPVIHAAHYPAPEPVVKAIGKTSVPTPATLAGHAGTDPAAQLSQGLARLIGKKQRLRNLQVEKRALTPPLARDATIHQARFRRGLVLETWVEGWSFAPAKGGTGDYLLSLRAHSRLARIDDGQVLWLSRGCRVGNDSHNTRLTARDLNNANRVQRATAAARDECVRQLARDFFAGNGNP